MVSHVAGDGFSVIISIPYIKYIRLIFKAPNFKLLSDFMKEKE